MRSQKINCRTVAFFVARSCALVLASGFVLLNAGNATAQQLETDQYNPACGIKIAQQKSVISVSWPIDSVRHATMEIDLNSDEPLVKSISVIRSEGDRPQPVANGLDPVILIRVGNRDLKKRGGWTIFFDRMQEKRHEMFQAQIGRNRAVASSSAQRATLTIGEVSAGPFRGVLRWTFYRGSPFVLQQAELKTARERTAFLYDAGLVCRGTQPSHLSWHESTGTLRRDPLDSITTSRNVAVRGRTICAEFDHGAVAIFPPPHRYFYPLDFSNNLSNIWIGSNYESQSLPMGFGIRHDPAGDKRYVPWFNAPVDTAQELGMFMLISSKSAEETLAEVARLTRLDRFESLPGHTVFSSHYHVEHTRELLEAQNDADAETYITAKTPSGRKYRIPPRLQTPGFTQVFREMGIDIVHLAEFHFGATPRMDLTQRLEHLEHLHAEARRLSDKEFLLLPGEEPNVHLGGHWISFFPRPVYWVLNRPEGTPLVTDHPKLGKVYHVGGKADVLRLLQAERGLAWTAHPRIKGSTGYPDRYRNELFFQSDRFLGAAWKAMPADLSQPRLGTRVLNLLDDMSNWGDPKYVLGEVDVFKIEPDHELYAHMNVNYLRIDQIPDFDSGWQSVLDALRSGQFFVTTGEVLIPGFTVGDRESGESVETPVNGKLPVQLNLKWTFPLAYAEIISGDGKNVRRHKIDLSNTSAFGEHSFNFEVELAGQRWVRAEVWDVAMNGALTQPVWLHPPRSP